MQHTFPLPSLDVAPFRLTGTVIGVLMNHRPALYALGEAVNQAPYKAAPKAPVLFVKPRNTLARSGQPVAVPDEPGQVEVSAQLGIVIGRQCTRVAPEAALAHVAGYLVVNDISLPHSQFYRPSVRLKARDGFCPLGARVVPADQVAQPDALEVRVLIDGQLVQVSNTGDRFRGVAQLIADVSAFMTLVPGDILTLGGSHGAPLARAGQAVRIEIEGIGHLDTPLVREQESAT